jgi:hypothetical protein
VGPLAGGEGLSGADSVEVEEVQVAVISHRETPVITPSALGARKRFTGIRARSKKTRARGAEKGRRRGILGVKTAFEMDAVE